MIFSNLDFEDAVFPNAELQRIPIEQALPSWKAFTGTNEVTLIQHNHTFLDSAGVSVFDSPGPWGIMANQFIDGQYTVGLFSGIQLLGSEFVHPAIAQTAIIPENASTLRFLAWPTTYLAISHLKLIVTLNGTIAPLHYYFTSTNNVARLAIDVSSHAGQMTELRFTSYGQHCLDNIEFSESSLEEIAHSLNTTGIPQPTILDFQRDGYLLWTNTVSCAVDPVYEVQHSRFPAGPWDYFSLVHQSNMTFVDGPGDENPDTHFYRVLWVGDRPTLFEYEFVLVDNEWAKFGNSVLQLHLSTMPDHGSWTATGDPDLSGTLHPIGTGKVRLDLQSDQWTVWLIDGREDELFLRGQVNRQETAGGCQYVNYSGRVYRNVDGHSVEIGDFYPPGSR